MPIFIEKSRRNDLLRNFFTAKPRCSHVVFTFWVYIPTPVPLFLLTVNQSPKGRKGGSRNFGPLCLARNYVEVTCYSRLNNSKSGHSIESTTMAASWYLCLVAVHVSSRRGRLHDSQSLVIALTELKFQAGHCCQGPNLSPA